MTRDPNQPPRRKLRRRLLWCLAVLVLLAGGVVVYLDEQHRYDLRTESFTFTSGGNDLAATLAVPNSEGPHGVVVFVHGDGAIDADHDGGYLPMWERLARAGYATVSWDKPGVGGSTGNWLDQDMAERAAEVVNALDALDGHPDLDVGDVGVMGFSQAGWVLPLLPDLTDIDFVIAASPAIDWLEQGRYLTDIELGRTRADVDLRGRVHRADQAGNELVADGDYAAYRRWHRSLPPDVQAYFGPMSEDRWRFAVANRRLDARETLPAMQGLPVLLLVAGQDENVDIEQTERTYRQILGGPCLTVHHYGDADHSLLDHDGLGLTLTAIFEPRSIFADDLLDDLGRFTSESPSC